MGLQKIQIGKHILKNNAFLAPMAGITDVSFRSLATRFGAGLVVSEMIASASLMAGQRDMLRRLKTCSDDPHIVQLSGNQARWLELGAKMAADAGADIIDINMGCPSKKVTNGTAGAALMKEPKKALKLIETVVKATDLPVTLKMRLGWDDENINAAQIAKSAQEIGVKMITIHARTRQQFYKGKARWHLVKEITDILDIPSVINGDIFDVLSAKNALKISGANAVMVGRAIYGRPWLVGQIGAALMGEKPIAAPTGDKLLELMLEHYEMMLSEYGQAEHGQAEHGQAKHGVRVARKHINWYLKAANITIDDLNYKSLLTSTDPNEVKHKLKQIFASLNERAA